MKKSKKILAVLLSVLMLLSSISVLSFAAKTNYHTSGDLDNLNAYSSLGSVTRLTTEERFDILADFADTMISNLGLGQQEIDASVLGKLRLDFSSINSILKSVDNIRDFTQRTVFFINIGNYVNRIIGIDNWTKGMSLEGNEITGGDRTKNILANLVSILDDSDTVNTLKQPLFTGQRPAISLPLGLNIYGFIPIDVTKACQAIGNIGGMLETIMQVNTGRGDDTLADINAMETEDDGDILKTANRAIWKLFTRPTLKSVYKENAAGQQVDENGKVINESSSAYLDTTRLLSAAPSDITYREVFVKKDVDAEKQIHRYAYEGKFDLLAGGYLTDKKYTASAEKDKDPFYYVRTPVYEKDAQGLNTTTVKYYVYEKNTDHSRLEFLKKSGYLLPTLLDNDTFTGANGFDNWMNTYGIGKFTVVSLAYKIVPLVFDNLGSVALNGALKHEIAKAFGISFESMGDDYKSAATKANVAKLIPSLVSGNSYTQATGKGEVFGEQGSSVYDWSAFKTVKTDKDTFYIFRYLDQIHIGRKSTVKNPYIDLVNFDYTFNKGDLAPFIPNFNDADNTVSNSAKGYNAATLEANTFVNFILDKIVNWDLLGGKKWEDGDNSKLNNNIVQTVKAVVNYKNSKYPVKGQAAEYLFGNNYREDYFNVISNAENLKDILVGGIGIIAGRYMPNLMLPDATEMKGQSIAAFGAVVLREILTQFLPNYNYDELIYENGSEGFKTQTPENSRHFGKMLKGKSNDYWEDVCLTMGVDFGMSYLTKLLDLGQNDGGWSEDYNNAKTYQLSEFESDSSKQWKETADWLIDYALGSAKEWQWNGNSVLTAYNGDIENPEDPFAKIEGLLTHYFAEWKDYVSVDQFTERPSDEAHLLKFVRGCLDSVLNVDFEKIIGKGTDYTASTYALSLNTGAEGKGLQALRDQKNIFNHFVPKVVALVNKFMKPLTNKDAFIPTGLTTVDDILKDVQNTNGQHYIDDVLINLVESLSELVASNIFDIVGKAANFFVGWKVLSQEFKDPTIGIENSASKKFIYTGNGANNNLKITNNSSGMLFKHLDGDGTVDQAYNIVIKAVESSSGSVALSGETTVAPFETVKLPISGTANNQGINIKITYKVTGKDGNVIADDQISYLFTYSSNNADEQVTYDEKSYATGFISKTYIKFKYPKPNMYAKTSDSNYSVGNFIYKNLVMNNNNGQDKTYEYNLTYRTGNSTLTRNLNKSGSIAKNENINFKMEITDESKVLTESGEYQLGTLNFYNKYRNSKYNEVNNHNLGKLYYSNNAKVKSSFEKAAKINWNGIDISAAGEAYTAFINKMTEAAKCIYGNVSENLPNAINQNYLNNLVSEIDAAYAAVKNFTRNSDDYTAIKNAEDQITNQFDNNAKNLQVTDYDKTTFFRYETVRKKAMKVHDSYLAPVSDDFYTANNANLSGKDLKAKVDGESNSNVKSFLTAALNYNTAGYNSAVANYKKPTYSALDLKNHASLIKYYGQIMLANKKDAPTAPSLDLIQDIVSTIGEDESDLKTKYTADSVAAYMSALKELRQDGFDHTRPSDEFTAKYDMQVAINGLMPKSKSMKENGNYGMLEELAKFVLQQMKDGKLTESNLKAGYNYADTQKALISALGYEYAEGANTKQLFKNSAFNELSVDRKTSPVMKDYVQTRYDNLLNELVKFKITVPISEFSRYQIRDINKVAQTFTSRMLVNIPNFDQLYSNDEWKVEITKLGFATLKRSDVGNSGVAALEALKNLKNETENNVSALKTDTTSRPDKIAISTTSKISQNTGSLNANYGQEMSKHFYALKMNCAATTPGSIYIAPYIIYKDPVTQTEKVEWMFRIVHPNFTYEKSARPFEN